MARETTENQENSVAGRPGSSRDEELNELSCPRTLKQLAANEVIVRPSAILKITFFDGMTWNV